MHEHIINQSLQACPASGGSEGVPGSDSLLKEHAPQHVSLQLKSTRHVRKQFERVLGGEIDT